MSEEGFFFFLVNEKGCFGKYDLYLLYLLSYFSSFHSCCSQSPGAPDAGEKHLQKKCTLIGVVSGGDLSILKSMKSDRTGS